MTDVCAQLKASDVVVSLFIDAQKDQIDAAKQCGAPVIELHTGHYADTTTILRFYSASNGNHLIGTCHF
jgi:pyridoxine 5-phosphate synthase